MNGSIENFVFFELKQFDYISVGKTCNVQTAMTSKYHFLFRVCLEEFSDIKLKSCTLFDAQLHQDIRIFIDDEIYEEK